MKIAGNVVAFFRRRLALRLGPRKRCTKKQCYCKRKREGSNAEVHILTSFLDAGYHSGWRVSQIELVTQGASQAVFTGVCRLLAYTLECLIAIPERIIHA